MEPISPTTESPSLSQPITPAASMRSSTLALILVGILLSVILYFLVPPLINYSRFIIPDDVANLMGRPGLKPDQAAQVTEAVRDYHVIPPRTFFPVCAALIAGLFALVEGICWRKGTIILWAAIVGPAVGVAMGYAVSETSMMFFYNSGKAVNPALTDGLSMQTISLGLIGSGAGLAVGLTARSLLAMLTAGIAGIMSGFAASCIFVIGTSVLFPLQDVFYPIPGMKLEATSDYGSIAIWSIALPICLAIALSAARKKGAQATATTVST